MSNYNFSRNPVHSSQSKLLNGQVVNCEELFVGCQYFAKGKPPCIVANFGVVLCWLSYDKYINMFIDKKVFLLMGARFSEMRFGGGTGIIPVQTIRRPRLPALISLVKGFFSNIPGNL